MDEQKFSESISTIKLASEISEAYYHKPIDIAYSGGKDSDAILQLAIDAGINFRVSHSLTTVDAPETINHVREMQKKIQSMGKTFEIIHPRLSMWKLIEKKMYPPTRVGRYCCSEMKETTVKNQLIAIGSRRSESRTRSEYLPFHILGWDARKEKVHGYDEDHVRNVFHDALKMSDVLNENVEKENAYDCKFITSAKRQKKIVVYPILYWTEQDVWDYLKERSVEVNPLYAKGFKRVGCIGCPLGGWRGQIQDFEAFPKYKENYIKAFNRMIEMRKKMGRDPIWKNGRECMDWWLGVTPVRQESLFEQLEEDSLIDDLKG